MTDIKPISPSRTELAFNDFSNSFNECSRAIPSLFFTTLSIVSFGLHEHSNKKANSLVFIATILPDFHKGCVHLIKGDTPYSKKPELKGIITESCASRIFKSALDQSKQKSILKRHITSRITFAVAAIAVTVTRIFDAILGCFIAPLCFIPFVHSQAINDLAYRQLTFLGLINDLCCAVRGIQNPTAL